MPKRRPPKEVWDRLREETWNRDGQKCKRCRVPIALKDAHCDHIKSGKQADNSIENRRTLCRRCHVLRADSRHRGMIAAALRDGLIPPNWRELVWGD